MRWRAPGAPRGLVLGSRGVRTCGRRPWTPPARPAAPGARRPVKELGTLAREGRWWPWSPTPVRVPVQDQSRRNTRGHGRCAHPGARGPAALHTRLMTLSARLIHLAGAPWSSRRNENTPERRPRRSPRICGVSEPSRAPTRSAGPAAWLGARGSSSL